VRNKRDEGEGRIDASNNCRLDDGEGKGSGSDRGKIIKVEERAQHQGGEDQKTEGRGNRRFRRRNAFVAAGRSEQRE